MGTHTLLLSYVTRGGVVGRASPALAGPLFSRSVGLVPKLQGRSEDETIGPGVPRKLAFAVRVRVSRNRSHSFTGGSGARRGPTGLHRHLASSPGR